MKYHLSYNEQTGQFRIDETGKTIQTNDTIGFVNVAGSMYLSILLTFTQTMAYCAVQNKQLWTVKQIQECIRQRHMTNMVINVYHGNDF